VRPEANANHNADTGTAIPERTQSILVYDIFSDDPKDVLHFCERHSGFSGDPAEGYFTCAGCDPRDG